ncbi:hypothetical protein DEJ44_12865 [Streptomyces venezuelae]|nr:hypothetical protein DEJ44_12865 [Streptomyces venezuelae]
MSARRRRLRSAAAASLGAALLLTLSPLEAAALPPDPAKHEAPREDLALEGIPAEARAVGAAWNAGLARIDVAPPPEQKEAPAGTATPPPGGSADVTFDAPAAPPAGLAAAAAAGEETDLEPAGSLPVKLGQAPGGVPPTGSWNVDLAARNEPAAAGVDGALITVTAPASGSVPVEMQFDYRSFENLYGAEWASRLTFVQFPECYRETPEVEECQAYEELETVNDTGGKTLTATVDPTADSAVQPAAESGSGSGLSTMSGGGDKAVIGAVDSGGGAGGSFKATPLISSGKWSAGGSSGAFTWSYPLVVPPAPAGPVPDVSFDYNSQIVDGKTAGTSPQASWIGEGWEYDPGHIERRYRTCKDDRKTTAAGAPNNTAKKDKTSDLCWASYNAVLSLGGKTVELVRQGTTNIYRPQQDDGMVVELKSGGTENRDNDGEYWIATTPDGTRYHYGLNKVGGGHADTDSVLTVPVFGNHPGEPCHAETFAASRCNGDANKQQAWRWGLDKVVDVHGNVMIVNWRRETNHYAVNKKFKTPEAYDRAATPESIEYGLRDPNLGATPSAKIDFLLKERCLQTAAECDPAKFDDTANPASYRPWWDSPGSLNCKATSKLCPAFPSFWSRLRLGGVDTYGQRPGSTALARVDSYTLNHSFPRDWYDSSPGLWLKSITRRGFAPGDSAGTLLSPAGVSFEPYVVGEGSGHPLTGYLKDKQLPNLVPRSPTDPRPGFTRPRIGTVATEHGGDIEVTYKGGCRVQPTTAPEDNHGTCYPVRWSPDGEEDKPALAWFNKYVVHTVTETDKITGVSARITTRYEYSDAAWAASEDEFVPAALRTHSVWRGYRSVATIKGSRSTESGSAQTQSYSVARYFRGVGGEVRDSKNAVTLASADEPQYAGMIAETITYDGTGGRIVKRVLNFPWSKQTASRSRDGGVDPILAHRAGVRRTDAIQTVHDTWQALRTVTEVDPDHGLPVQAESMVVKPSGTGEALSDYTCARTEYVENSGLHLVGLPRSSRSTATPCAEFDTADPAREVIASVRTSYDGGVWGAVPTRGLATTVAELDGTGTTHSVVTTTTYDPLGRVRKVTRPEVGTTETRYTPGDTGGPVTSVETVNAKGYRQTTTLDPGRGLELTVTDANLKTTRNEYDGLGRLIKGWSAARSQGNQTPDVQIGYQLAVATSKVTTPTAVVIQTLTDSGAYSKQSVVYDGLMRPVQSQSEAHGPGRLVSDTRYDDHGLVAEQTNPYLVAGEPDTLQFKRPSDTVVPSMNRTRYDGLERPVAVTAVHSGRGVHTSVTSYGDTDTLREPAGDGAGPVTKTLTDARGRVVEVQYSTVADWWRTGWRSTRYTYDGAGNRTTVTEPGGSVRQYAYDARGRVVRTVDPDTGESTFGYDDADRRVRITDSRDTTYTTYDELNRITAIRTGSPTASPTREFVYDTVPGALGKQAEAVRHDASGDYISRVIGYDSDYRPTGREVVIPANSMTGGLSGTYRYGYTYTRTGKPLSTTLPAVGGLAAEKVITRYNSDGLPHSTSGHAWYTSGATYSPYGEVLRTVSGSQPYRVWTTNFIDESTGRLQRTVADRETSTHRIHDSYYSYDSLGNVTSNARKLTDGATSAWDNQCYTYDVLGQMVHAWTSSGAPASTTGCKSADGTSWGYRADGALSTGPIADAADAQGDTDPAAPDADLISSLADAGPAAGTTSTGATAYWQSYVFDALGNRASMVERDMSDPAKNVSFAYGYGTVVPATESAPAHRTQPHVLTSRSSSAAGQGAAYTPDAAGNTLKRDVPGGVQDLKWNQENKPETVTKGGAVTRYVYDADGSRLLENSPTGTVLYLGETELTAQAGVITKATRSYAQAKAPTVVRTALNGATSGHKLLVILADHLGTGTTTVDLGSGQQVTRRSFKPYGEARGPQPTAWPNKRGYLGVGIEDTAFGLIHLGAREYDPSTGRFISADPVVDVSDPLQSNGYAYSHNSPVSRSDPTGLYDPDQRAWEQQQERKKREREYWASVNEKYTKAHDATIVAYQAWLVAVKPHGGGRVTVDLQKTMGYRDSENWIPKGSAKSPGKNGGWADLLYWTDDTVYVYEVKNWGGKAEKGGKVEVENYVKYLKEYLATQEDKKHLKVKIGPDLPPLKTLNPFKPNEMVDSFPSTVGDGVIAYKTKSLKKPPAPPAYNRQPQEAPEKSWWKTKWEGFSERAGDWWHTNVENHDWSNNPWTPTTPAGGPIPIVIPVIP